MNDIESAKGNNPDRPETVLSGLGVSQGIAIGPAYLVQVEQPQAPQYEVNEAQIADEISRFQAAVGEAQNQISALKEKAADLPEPASEEVELLLDAHLAMLSGSRLVKGVESCIQDHKTNAEYAVQQVMDNLAEQFAGMDDQYLAARIDDVRAVGGRVIRILMDLPYMSLGSVPQGGIVLAEEISPADTALLDPRQFAGIASVHGGAAGHTAIMARSLGLPAVLGVSGLVEYAHHGDMAIIDGIEGRVILNPSEENLALYRGRLEELEHEKESLKDIRDLPCETRDAVAVTLRANLEMPRELDAALEAGANGIGLFRTEFMFMNRPDLPDEQEQFEMLAEVVRGLGGAPMTIRTLDIGGDKLVRSLGQHMAECDNPALGLRAIRLSLKEPDLLKTQFAAILRAGALGPVRVLLPLVTTADEVRRARRLLEETAAELKEKNIAIADPLPPLGVMIEIPAAALAADSLAAVADFFALGTNDLIQYTIAIDRGNDQVADLYNPLNPAVLRLIEFSVQAGLRARIPVSICGEMASDVRYTGLLLGLGVREMSMGAASLPQIKKRIRDIDMIDANRHTQLVMAQYDSGRITTLVNEFNRDV